jgi:DNA-binding NarL/FixJ family response regulator
MRQSAANPVNRNHDSGVTWINHTAFCDSSQFIVKKPFGYLGWRWLSLVCRSGAICSNLGGCMAQTRPKILCIEDDRETAALVAEDLTDRGFEVELAYSGREGLLAIMQATPDLVLCDIGMPTMTGLEVLERLNELAPRLGPVPFLFLTALADREMELKGRRLGADDYITKPIDFERLAFIISARLAGVARIRLMHKLPELNSREVEILTLVSRGKTSIEIAHKLRLSKRTIDFHIDNARSKLGAATRTEAATRAATAGLIKP